MHRVLGHVRHEALYVCDGEDASHRRPRAMPLRYVRRHKSTSTSDEMLQRCFEHEWVSCVVIQKLVCHRSITRDHESISQWPHIEIEQIRQLIQSLDPGDDDCYRYFAGQLSSDFEEDRKMSKEKAMRRFGLQRTLLEIVNSNHMRIYQIIEAAPMSS